MISNAQTRVDANGVCRENVAGHAGVLFAHFNAAPKSAVFANVAISGFTVALRATGGIIRLRGLFFGMRQSLLQT